MQEKFLLVVMLLESAFLVLLIGGALSPHV